MPSAPPRWSEQELDAERQMAERLFRTARQQEGPAAFYTTWDLAEKQVRDALAATGNLREIKAETLQKQKALWQTLRYVCAPRISEEDLWTLVGKKFKILPAQVADVTAKTISDFIDLKRFPWVILDREPEDVELRVAVAATTTLLAHELFGTSRRGSASKVQEELVSKTLVVAGLKFDASRKPIASLDDLKRNCFSRERKVGGAKCDLPIRLSDGKFLALECKVSNGPKNSWKRVQREVGGKADTWKQVYGNQVITGGVLAGVIDLKCLVDVQNNNNVAIFWQHDLKPLVDFVTS